jgi:Domain of unknown function (DUF4124)
MLFPGPGTVTRFADENCCFTSNAKMYGNSLRLSRVISGTDWYGAIFVALILLVCPARMLRADDIYKSVDAEGHVVYSDRADRSGARKHWYNSRVYKVLPQCFISAG